MRPRSELLQAILNKISGRKNTPSSKISQELFLCKAFEVVNQEDYLQCYKEGTLSQHYCVELRRLQELFQSKFVVGAWDKLNLYLRKTKGKASMMSSLMFSAIMANSDMASTFGKKVSKNPLTAIDVVQEICKNPTQQVKKILIESDNDDEVEEDTDNLEEILDEEFLKSLNEPDTEDNPAIEKWLSEVKRAKKETDDFEDIQLNTKFDETFSKEFTDKKISKSTEPDFSKGKLNDIIKNADELYRYLSSTVFGQEHAVATFVSGYFQAEIVMHTQKDRRQPRATFLFAGPPGVGKTFLAEQSAKALKLPFKRFDMSEYADKEAFIEFAGSDKVYKNGKSGNVTDYVSGHPKSILLFDEIEKANISVIYLFLQILDAGRLRDNFTDEEVSFNDTIIIFTTNVGKRMYDDKSIDLTQVSGKSVLTALASDKKPDTNEPAFPMAMCSRFAAGNVVMFNRIGIDDQLKIVSNELHKQADSVSKGTGINIEISPDVVRAIMFAQGGKSDARTVKGKSVRYFFDELYDLLRMIGSASDKSIDKLQSISYDVQLSGNSEIATLFHPTIESNVLIFADKAVSNGCKKAVKGINIFTADNFESAIDIIERQPMLFILCDIKHNMKTNNSVLNIEDVQSEGKDFFNYAHKYYDVPIYVLATQGTKISKAELLSLTKSGAQGVVEYCDNIDELNKNIQNIADNEHCQKNLTELAKRNKVLSYRTMQSVTPDNTHATLTMYDLELSTAIDAEDNEGVLNDVSRPDVSFEDVIGANDAKEELNYFINFMKNPSKYLSHGVKPPKGILLYGPPGTGKTLLAKAVAGESGLTFIKAEGNQFLKKYVGEGVEAVHDIFAKARKYAPSILFIDEVEVIGKSRGQSQLEAGRDDVITAFLTEMDGFNTDTARQVFVLAATNYTVEQGQSNSLDSALLRRFDRRIYVDLPNKDERLQFITNKASKLVDSTLSKEQLDNIAVRSVGLSLADLDSVFELALRNVIKTNGYTMTDKVLEEAYEIYVNGEQKKWDSKELLRTARHEAGHAIMSYLCGNVPSYVTIVARGDHGGYVQQGDNENKGLYTKKELLDKVNTALAGRASEIVYYGEEDGVSTGASGDIKSATALVKAMICDYGMDSEFGCVFIDQSTDGEYHSKIMQRVQEIIGKELQHTVSVLKEHKYLLDALSQKLMEKTSLKQNEIADVLATLKK